MSADYFERVRSAISDVKASVQSISMRRSSSPIAQYQPTRRNTERELMRVEDKLTKVNNYNNSDCQNFSASYIEVSALKRSVCSDLGSTVQRMLS